MQAGHDTQKTDDWPDFVAKMLTSRLAVTARHHNNITCFSATTKSQSGWKENYLDQDLRDAAAEKQNVRIKAEL